MQITKKQFDTENNIKHLAIDGQRKSTEKQNQSDCR